MSFCTAAVAFSLSDHVSRLSAGQQIVRNLRASVFSSILRQEVAFFDKNRTGELINRLSADTAVVGRSITDNLSDGLRAVAQAAAGVSMMVSTSPLSVLLLSLRSDLNPLLLFFFFFFNSLFAVDIYKANYGASTISYLLLAFTEI